MPMKLLTLSVLKYCLSLGHVAVLSLCLSSWAMADPKPESTWQEFRTAMNHSDLAKAKQLLTSLPESLQNKAKLWLQIHKNPHLLIQKRFINTEHASDMVNHGLLRLAGRRPLVAGKVLNRVGKNINLSDQQRNRIKGKIALTLALRKNALAYQWFDKLDLAQSHKSVRAWRIRLAIFHRDWKKVLSGFDELTEEEKQLPRWLYWRARALTHLGKAQQAKEIYQTLAPKRGYYNFLASEHLQKNKSLQHVPLVVSNTAVALLQLDPNIQISKQLYQEKRYTDARKHWSKAISHLSPEEKAVAAKLAHNWGWHEQVIRAARHSHHLDDLKMRFPLPHREIILDTAKQNKIDPAFFYAMIRQESAFMHDAKSPAGAIGLMQLMPHTAKIIAKNTEFKINHPFDIIPINTNIKLAGLYLKKLKYRMKSNYVLMAASFNAGRYNIKRWLPKRGAVDPIIWIETIPWHETRQYLQNVLTYTVIYNHHLGEQTDFKTWLPKVRPAKYYRWR